MKQPKIILLVLNVSYVIFDLLYWLFHISFFRLICFKLQIKDSKFLYFSFSCMIYFGCPKNVLKTCVRCYWDAFLYSTSHIATETCTISLSPLFFLTHSYQEIHRKQVLIKIDRAQKLMGFGDDSRRRLKRSFPPSSQIYLFLSFPLLSTRKQWHKQNTQIVLIIWLS